MVSGFHDSPSGMANTKSWSLRSKLIDGEFPNYGGALPPRSPNPARVDRAALLAAVTRIAQIARDGESRGMTLEVAAGEIARHLHRDALRRRDQDLQDPDPEEDGLAPAPDENSLTGRSTAA
jgi:DNA polymerase III sliding clamp (beta) subunit (PCNA family)